MSARQVVPIIFACVACASCDRAPLSGPPELRLGSAECAECGMIISEDRCSAAILVDRDGRREHLVYDDIGCMLDDEREGLQGVAIERYVRDYGARRWASAETAAFVIGDPEALRTPMSSGMVAFADRARAEAAVVPRARITDRAGAAEARRLRAEARRSGAASP